MDANVAGVRIMNETYGLDIVMSKKKSFADAMHTIHHAAVTRKNDGKGKVAIENQAGMIYHVTTCQMLRTLVRPIKLINFTNSRQGNPLARQGPR